MELQAEGAVQPGLADRGIGHMQIVFHNVLPDGLGGGVAAVGLDALDVFGQVLSRRHQDGGGAHGNAA